MTPQELSDIDRQVAEAIGLSVYRGYAPCWVDDDIPNPVDTAIDKEGDRILNAFRPSVLWSDAMYAAEEAGLWREWLVFGRESYAQDNHYYVSQHAHGDPGYNPIGRAETGPLAICAAILKLKGKA